MDYRLIGNMMRVVLVLVAKLMLWRPVEAALCTSAICEYDWTVTMGRSMMYREGSELWRVGLRGRELYLKEHSSGFDPMERVNETMTPDQVLTADGFEMSVMVINGQFPGPTIEVYEGAQVAIRLTNNLLNDGLSIHWHGILQRKTQWMDGVSFVTQCPISPRQSFMYRWTANPPGTLWYHSHLNTQRTDGLHGLIIIRKAAPTLTWFPLLIHDWFHELGGETEYLGTHRMDDLFILGAIYNGGLINGRGRMNDEEFPLSILTVRRGTQYELRIVAAGLETSYEVSIDDHAMEVIESDSQELSPVMVDTIHIHLGESFVVRIQANQPVGTYWIRADISKAPLDPKTGKPAVPNRRNLRAVLAYEGADTSVDPTSSMRRCTTDDPCTQFNCIDGGYPDSANIKCIFFSDVTSTHEQNYLNEEYGLDDDEVHEYFLNFAFMTDTPYDGASINSRKLIFPKKPLYQQGDHGIVECNDAICDANGCECTHILSVPFDKTIQLVYTNIRQVPNDAVDSIVPHPIHLHGYDHAIVGMGFPDADPETGALTRQNQDVECNNKMCSKPRWRAGASPKFNLVNPPVKNTIVLPPGGYAAVRFRSNNPGYWLLHCHIEMHVIAGMGMVISVEPWRAQALPPGFPQCVDFDWSASQYNQALQASNSGGEQPGPPTPGPIDPILQHHYRLLYSIVANSRAQNLFPTTGSITINLAVDARNAQIVATGPGFTLVEMQITRRLTWTDPTLTWNPVYFGGINLIQIPASAIWRPAVTHVSSVGAVPDGEFGDGYILTVTNTGLVHEKLENIGRFYCIPGRFPGSQLCNLRYVSTNYDTSKVNLVLAPGSRGLGFDALFSPGKLILVDQRVDRVLSTNPCCPGTLFSEIRFSFTLMPPGNP